MKIDDLIVALQRIREAKGNLDIQASSFCGTNNGFVVFDIQPFRKNFKVEDQLTGEGKLSLHVDINPTYRQQIIDGQQQMIRMGHDWIPSQYVSRGAEVRRNTTPPYSDNVPW